MKDENNKLFIGNLSYNITDDQLVELFSIEELKVVDAKVITDRETGRPRGFGFVTLETPEMAEKAIELMNGKEVDGRAIIVNVSRPQSNDRPRSGGYQGGGSSNGGYRSSGSGTGRRY